MTCKVDQIHGDPQHKRPTPVGRSITTLAGKIICIAKASVQGLSRMPSGSWDTVARSTNNYAWAICTDSETTNS
jgi:hypothetical protein